MSPLEGGGGNEEPKEQVPVVTRFAPSPTGELHLGGLRTALFNHLLARSTGGKWILRIDDTDRKRFVPTAAGKIQDILKWSGLDYDEGPDKPGKVGPYVQSERLQLYTKYADRLLQSGHAYRDFRFASIETDETPMVETEEYDVPNEEEMKKLIEDGRSFVVRLHMPKDQDVQYTDLVYGNVNFPKGTTKHDPIIIKSDGWPTYHLAHVVDDLEMGITHVLRGEEWIPSMPIHLQLYKALGMPCPKFVHLPLLVNPDGTKLSKREGDVHVEKFRGQRYEPEAMLNFVASLGYNWHRQLMPPSETDDFSTRKALRDMFGMNEMIEGFKIEDITRSRATPDRKKLNYLNRQLLARKMSEKSSSGNKILIKEVVDSLQMEPDVAKRIRQLDAYQQHLLGSAVIARSHNVSVAIEEAVEILSPIDLDSPTAQAFWAQLDHDVADVAWRAGFDELEKVRKHNLKISKHGRTRMVHTHQRYTRYLKKDLPHLLQNRASQSQYFKLIRFAFTGKPDGPTLGDLLVLQGREVFRERLAAARQWLSDKKIAEGQAAERAAAAAAAAAAEEAAAQSDDEKSGSERPTA